MLNKNPPTPEEKTGDGLSGCEMEASVCVGAFLSYELGGGIGLMN